MFSDIPFIHIQGDLKNNYIFDDKRQICGNVRATSDNISHLCDYFLTNQSKEKKKSRIYKSKQCSEITRKPLLSSFS